MNQRLTEAQLLAHDFHRGALSAVRLEQRLLDLGWHSVRFTKQDVFAKWENLEYNLSEK